jgi:hypothetical protein
MFRHKDSNKVNIHGIDKHTLLVALFNNAKKSKWTEGSIGNLMCPDEFVRDMMADFYQPRIEEKINQLYLSEEKAKSILESSKYVDNISYVAIRIDFSKDIIDVTKYDELHKQGNNILSAKDIVDSLRSEPLPKSNFGNK